MLSLCDRWVRVLAIVVALSVAWGPLPAWAWNDTGHFLVARIAFLQLLPAQREAIFRKLQKHPHYETLLVYRRPAEVTEMEWAFLRAATWSDYIRPPKNFSGEVSEHPKYKFHRGPWHYVNFPYRAGQMESALPREPLAHETNILAQLDLTMRVLRGQETHDPGAVADLDADANQAVRLCWLFHLVGDLHQPLHAAALVDAKLFHDGEHGDQGGNLLAIRPDASSAPLRLHAYWDGLLGRDSRFESIRDLADQLTRDPALAPAKLPELTTHRHFRDWAAESYALAKTQAYLDGRLPRIRWADFDSGTIEAEKVPSYSAADAAKAHQLARRRVVIAGHRLADQLKLVVGN